MSKLATYQGNLPDTMEDLAQFLLIAPEKANALRAEIRAIQKVGLAKAVYDQKLEEQRRLCDMILDASIRLGEMTKAMPKGSGGNHGNQYTVAKNDTAVDFGKTTTLSHSQIINKDSTVDFEKPADSTVDRLGNQCTATDSAVVNQKPKSEAVRDLGFSPKQVERFETLADNKDLVEQEKAKAREENRIPTRTNVIDMAKARKDRFDRDIDQIDDDAKIAKAFVHATHAPLTMGMPDEVAAAVWRNSKGNIQADIEDINLAIAALEAIRNKLLNGVKNYGK